MRTMLCADGRDHAERRRPGSRRARSILEPASAHVRPESEQKAFDYLGLTAAEQHRTRALRAKLETELEAAARAA